MSNKNKNNNLGNNTISTWLSPLLALVASSCCVIQLVLNVFSMSCAGFAILNPYRSFFTTLTVLSIAYNLYQYGLTRQTKIAIVTSLLLCCSNEIIQIANEGNVYQQVVLPILATIQNNLPSSSSIQSAGITTPTTTTYKIIIDGIGCMSCANRIKNTLDAAPIVKSAYVFLENATAIVTTNSNKEYSLDLKNTIENIDKKYTAMVVDKW